MKPLYFLVLIFYQLLVFSQNEEILFPYSFEHKVKKRIKTIVAPFNPIDLATAPPSPPIIEEKRYEAPPLVWDTNKKVAWNLKQMGTFEEVKNGKLWRMRVTSPSAKKLGLWVGNLEMPKGAFLFAYNENKQEIKKADARYQYFDVKLDGETIILEYFEPKNTALKARIEITLVSHYFQEKKDIPYSQQNDLVGKVPTLQLSLTKKERQSYFDSLKIDRQKGVSKYLHYKEMIDINFENFGIWERLPSKNKVWRAKIHAKNAVGITYEISDLNIRENAVIYVYERTRKNNYFLKQTVRQADFDKYNKYDQSLFLRAFGNELLIEYNEVDCDIREIFFEPKINIKAATIIFEAPKNK